MKKRVIIPMLVFVVVFSNAYASSESNNSRSKTVKSENTADTATEESVDTDSAITFRGKVMIINLLKAKPYKEEDGPVL